MDIDSLAKVLAKPTTKVRPAWMDGRSRRKLLRLLRNERERLVGIVAQIDKVISLYETKD